MTWRQAFSQDFESGHPISGTVMPFISGRSVLHGGWGAFFGLTMHVYYMNVL